jgi:hypothetical protein
LNFSSQTQDVEGRRIRAARFDERSMLPIAAACVVANAMREALSAALQRPAEVRLFEPVLPSPQAWQAILTDARAYRVQGANGDAVLVVRTADAAAIAAVAFGEDDRDASALSALETVALERTIGACARALTPLCGEVRNVEPCSDPGMLATFFDVQIERPVRARIGVGLKRDPAAPAIACGELEVGDLPLTLAVRAPAGTLPAACLAALEPGSVLSLGSGAVRGFLAAAGRTLAHGECGVLNGRYALILDGAPLRQGSTTAA